MTLRWKTIIVIGVTFATLLGILIAIWQNILVTRFNNLEDESTTQNVERAMKAVQQDIDSVSTAAADWGIWDDTYFFAQDRNQAYIDTNFQDSSFTSLKMNLIVVVDTSGEILHGETFDMQEQSRSPMPDDLLAAHLSIGSPLLQHPNEESVSGILILPEGATLLAAQPILDSQGNGPVLGTLIMGRYLSDDEIQRLAVLTGLSVDCYQFGDSALPDDFQVAQSSLSGNSAVFTRPLSSDRIGGYGLLNDIYGNPALILKVDLPRDIYKEGQQTVLYMVLSLLIVGAIIGLAIVLLLEKAILSRFFRLGVGLRKIREMGDVSQRLPVSGRDEISHLTTDVNNMLVSLQGAQGELKESRESFYNIVEKSAEGVLIVDSEGVVRFANGYAQKLFTHPGLDLVGNKLGISLISGESTEVDIIRDEGVPGVGEMRVLDTQWQGKTAYLVSVRDITERGHMEQTVRSSEEKLRVMFDSAIDGIVVVDMLGNIQELNEGITRITGYTRDDFIGRSALDFVYPEDQKIVVDMMASTLGDKRLVVNALTLRMVHKNGTMFVGELACGVMHDKQGNITGFIGTLRDVTERKQMEDQLRASEEKLRAMFESIHDAVIVSDMQGTIVDVNDAALGISGWTREQWIGRNAIEIIAEKDRAAAIDSIMKQAQGGVTIESTEITLVLGEGRELDAEFTSSLLRDAAGNPIGTVTVARDITERKKAAEVVRASEEKLRAIFDSAIDGILLIDLMGNFQDANEATLKMTGYSREDLIGKSALEFVFEEDRQKVVNELTNTLTSKQLVSVKPLLRLVRKDGSLFYAELGSGMILDKQGNVTGLIGVMRDVTDRKRLEDEVRASEQKLRGMFEAMSDSVVLSTPDGRVMDINEAAVRLHGFKDKGEMIGKNALELVAESDRQKVAEQGIKAAKSAGTFDGLEYRVLKSDGTEFDAEFSGVPLRDDTGKVVSWVTVSRDITERKRLEKAIMENEAKFRELFENMSNGVAVYEAVDNGEDFVFKDFNRAAEKIGNTTKDKVIGKSIAEAYPKLKEFGLFAVMQRVWRTGNAERMPAAYYEDELRKGWRDNYVYKLPTGEVVAVYEDVTDHITAMESVRSSEEKLRAMFESTSDGIVVTDMRFNILDANEAAARIFGHKSKASLIGTSALGMISADKVVDADGKQINIEFSLSQMRDAAGNLTGNIGVVRDVTVRRRMEANLKKTVTNLERSNRDMQQFVYIASHDLQEPLRMISSFTQLLNRRYKGKLDAEADDFITYAVNGANVLQERIQALAIFSRVTTQGKPFVHTDMGLVLDKVLAALGTAIEASKAVVTHDPMPSIIADSAQMAQVFQYLIDNSIKFRSEATPQVHVSAKDQDSEWLFSVRDNGMGIMPEFKERIFVLFQRLHGVEFGGTGIGLPVCKKIVERHGGRIWVESEPGKGSTFYFAIPKEMPEEEPTAGPAAGA